MAQKRKRGEHLALMSKGWPAPGSPLRYSLLQNMKSERHPIDLHNDHVKDTYSDFLLRLIEPEARKLSRPSLEVSH
jgi:hypothetical protein